jgi:DNA-binding Lrp family transcriptional regulator
VSKVKWTFLSNHGRVFCYLARHPRATIEKLAQDANLSVAGVHRIINDLEEGGYIIRQKVGRCNEYTVHPELPMRHHLEWDRTVADILIPISTLHQIKQNTSSVRYETTKRKLERVRNT